MSEFTDAFERGTKDMTAISSGTCPGCTVCAEDHGIRLLDDDGNDRPASAIDAEFRAMWTTGAADSEPSFSWSPCGVCSTNLGGDRNVWHWIDPNDPTRAINHESDMCTDCVMFLAYGTEPEEWRAKR